MDFTSRVTDDNRRDVVLVCELWQNDARVALTTTLFVPDKHARLTEPEITAQLEADNGQLHIQLQAQALARFVEVALDGADVIFSDNYFDLPAQSDRDHHVPAARWLDAGTGSRGVQDPIALRFI